MGDVPATTNAVADPAAKARRLRRRFPCIMPGRIDFQYDSAKDIVIATPHWRLATKEDCETWYQQWDSHMSKYRRKMDCVVLLSDFHVEAAIASAWGEYRAKLNNTY